MRVLIALEEFDRMVPAARAAEAIAAGWRRVRPDDTVDALPMTDGGPGFLDVLAACLGGERRRISVAGPFGDPVRAELLLVAEDCYLEAAQACGPALTGDRGALRASSRGVGELLRAAIDTGARRVIVGLGPSGVLDGGAGLLAALGADADRPLAGGLTALEGVTRVRLPPRPEVELIAATDVAHPLAGMFGAAKSVGPQLGLTDIEIPAWDAVLAAWGAATDRAGATEPGAGAAGGIGHALMLLGATRSSGFGVVADAVELPARIAAADLVLTGEASFDPATTAGSVPVEVAALATAALRPCVVLAGRVGLGAREMRTLGVESAYSLADTMGEDRARAEPYAALVDLAGRVARSWGM